jgi:hypothetical protein
VDRLRASDQSNSELLEDSVPEKAEENVFQSREKMESISFPKSVIIISRFIDSTLLRVG